MISLRFHGSPRRQLVYFLVATLSAAWSSDIDVAIAGPILEWTRLLATTGEEDPAGVVAAANGDVYIGGTTTGLLGAARFGVPDPFLARYSSQGDQVWLRQFGKRGSSHLIEGISADVASNVYLSGIQLGPEIQAVVYKYSSTGNELWVREFGASENENARGVAALGTTDVYVSGFTDEGPADDPPGTLDAFLSKYDSAGSLLWSREFGSTPFGNDGAMAVAVDALGNAFSVGRAGGDLGGTPAGGFDAFVTKWDPAGNLQWARKLGTAADDCATSVVVDPLGNVIVAGYTSGQLGAVSGGEIDVFVAKYDTNGQLAWLTQWGGENRDVTGAVTVNGAGDIFVGGWTATPPAGTVTGNVGFIAKFNALGQFQWDYRRGATPFETIAGVAVDNAGNIYAAGRQAMTAPGNGDAFLIKLREVPEPDAHALLFVAAIAIAGLQRAAAIPLIAREWIQGSASTHPRGCQKNTS
jgi:hypothetical protein